MERVLGEQATSLLLVLLLLMCPHISGALFSYKFAIVRRAIARIKPFSFVSSFYLLLVLGKNPLYSS